ncbi:MAG: 4-hydroxy-tetrahydrodipicolinate reductase [Treponema sp.]|jgi:4-hydroxy-tetrahydrodipicolinate reductase|nr:4-hydroxy-tetrahydrodipicolinate reductase [Treponema sp.]
MNIALIGYGKMGRLIESKALERGHRIIAAVEPYMQNSGSAAASGAPVYQTIAGAQALETADIAVEFTRPDSAPDNIRLLAERKIPVVCGTTGWYALLDQVSAGVRSAGSSLLWASNFSLGVNIFYRIAAYAARAFDPFPEYDVGGMETHHNKKADSPSGTAKTLVEKVLAAMTRKKRAAWDTLDGPPSADTIHFPSLRTGSVPGVHALLFDSPADTVEITHTARSREGFAAGALRAAEWLANCPGPGQGAGKARAGVFTMEDALGEILQQGGNLP